MTTIQKSIQNPAGNYEQEKLSRTWNLVEGLGMMTFILFLLWGLAYPFGVMGGNETARKASEIMMVAGALYMLFIAPFLHGDTATSWGLGNPMELWRLLKDSTPLKRILLGLVIIFMIMGLNYMNYCNWERVVKFFNLHRTSMRHWDQGFPGILGVFGFGGILSLIIVTCAIRYDNFLSAFRTAMITSFPLLALILLGAAVQRGWSAFSGFSLRMFLLGVFGYLFWGFVQQLLFSSYLGTRIRKGFGPSQSPHNAVPASRRPVFLALFTGIASLGCASAMFGLLRFHFGAEVIPVRALFLFLIFVAPLFLIYAWFYALDRKRLLVATLSGSCFGLIHINSYGLVAATFLLGILLSYVFMEDRNRNLVALGFIHGLLGSSFGSFFSRGDAGALEVDYSVGPWNVDHPTWPVMVIPVLCMAGYLGMIAWYAMRGRDRESR